MGGAIEKSSATEREGPSPENWCQAWACKLAWEFLALLDVVVGWWGSRSSFARRPSTREDPWSGQAAWQIDLGQFRAILPPLF